MILSERTSCFLISWWLFFMFYILDWWYKFLVLSSESSTTLFLLFIIILFVYNVKDTCSVVKTLRHLVNTKYKFCASETLVLLSNTYPVSGLCCCVSKRTFSDAFRFVKHVKDLSNTLSDTCSVVTDLFRHSQTPCQTLCQTLWSVVRVSSMNQDRKDDLEINKKLLSDWKIKVIWQGVWTCVWPKCLTCVWKGVDFDKVSDRKTKPKTREVKPSTCQDDIEDRKKNTLDYSWPYDLWLSDRQDRFFFLFHFHYPW